MIRLMQVILFLLSFSLEVEVRAEWATLLNQETLVQYPENCIDLCGYKTFPQRKYTLEIEGKKMTLGSDTIVLKKAADTYAFVSGDLLLEGTFRMELPVGSLVTEGDRSLVHLSKVGEQFVVRTLFGNTKLTAKGAKKEIEIPQGYENRVSGVSDKGYAEIGFPVSIDASDMIYKWALLYDGEKKQFFKEVSLFKDVHKVALEEVSRTYTEVSSRMIASHEAWLAKEKVRKEKERRERATLQRMFERKIMGLE